MFNRFSFHVTLDDLALLVGIGQDIDIPGPDGGGDIVVFQVNNEKTLLEN